MQGKEPLISIVVPVYNLEKYVGRCLDSIVEQSYGNLEVIIVDDGSRDGSRGIIEQFAEKDARIKPVFKGNQGVSMARRDGMAAATGDYVVLVDGDDFLDSNYIRALVGAVAGGAGIACARLMRLTAKYCSPLPRDVESEVSGIEFLQHLLCHDIFAGVGMLYRRDLLDDLRFFPDIPLWEDFLMNLQIALKPGIGSVRFVDEALYYYIQRPGTGNRRGVTLEYLEQFSGYVSGILSVNPEKAAQCTTEILADRVHWYSIYINKNHNPWIGDTPFAKALYKDVISHGKQLMKVGVPYSTIRLIGMYRYKWLRPAWQGNILMRKWLKSYRRRRTKSKESNHYCVNLK